MGGTFLVILACMFWALDTLIRYPMVERGLSPITIVLFEHIVLVLIFSIGIITSIKKVGELKLIDVFSFLVIGGLGSAVATYCFTQSFHYLNPSLVILLQKLQPLVVIVLAKIILKEEVQGQFLGWTLVCLIGGLLISSPDLIRFYDLITTDYGKVISDGALHGYTLVGISILCWGSATVFGKRLTLSGFDTRTIMGGRFLVGLLVLIPFVKWDQTLLLSDSQDYLRLFIMVLISGALAMWLYYQGLKRISAKTTAIAEMFFPFFAVMVNWFFLGKQLNDWQLLGGGILIIGSSIIQLKKL